MAKQKKIPFEKQRPNVDTSLEGLAVLRERYRPVGSGPLGVMRMVVTMIELLAKEKGYDLDSVEVKYLDGKYHVFPKS